jgi:hypothetical protein
LTLTWKVALFSKPVILIVKFVRCTK